ncbi:MAG: hypothetical protein KJZ56_12660 [Flavobacteriales bacterium]|nr:hypothetical protein [Flavobacteriales bacterium]
MSSYISPMSLPINSTLFSNKQKELNQLVGNLTLNEVKNDEQFTRTIKRIKEAILLKPVTFQEPKITGNYQIEKTVQPNYQDMWGGQRQVNVITVEFKFEGSFDLFGYSPNGLSFGSSSNMRVFQPDYGNVISVDIELQTLDKIAALNSANAQMEMTFGVINGNNTQAQQWSTSIEPTIESLLATKRKELLEFYS